MSHSASTDFDPATNPPPDGSSLTGTQLIALMGATLFAALVVLWVVSG